MCTLRRYGGTAGGTTVPPLYPQQVRRYHPCTLRRYDGTTPVPSGGTTVPPMYPQEVRRYHPCTWRWYACEIPVVFYTEITLGKMTVVPRTGTRVVPLYLVQVQGCTVVPRAGTRVVPLYLVQVQGWYRRTCSRCTIHSAPLNTSVLQFNQTTGGGRQQFSCKSRADATPNRSSFALPNPRDIFLRHAHHMTATQCCQYLLFHEFQ